MSCFLISAADRLRRPCIIVKFSTSADALQLANIALKMFSDEFAGAEMNIFAKRVEFDGCYGWHYTYDGSSFTAQMYIFILSNIFSASPLSVIDFLKFHSWFSTQTVPIIDGKVLGLHELSDVLDRDYQGFASNLVEMMKCKGSAVDIVVCLDTQPMHERAQIIGCDLWFAYGRKATQSNTLHHFRSLNDICSFKTSFRDHRILLRHVLLRRNVAPGAVVSNNEIEKSKPKMTRVEQSLIKSLERDDGRRSPTMARSSVDNKVEAIYCDRSKFYPRQSSLALALDRGDGTYDNDPSGQPTNESSNYSTTTFPPPVVAKALEVVSTVNILLTVLALVQVLAAAAVGTLAVAVVVVALVALVGCKARARACSSVQSRPNTSPFCSRVPMLLATLLTSTSMVYGYGCDPSACFPTACILTDGHLTVPNTTTTIGDCKLEVA